MCCLEIELPIVTSQLGFGFTFDCQGRFSISLQSHLCAFTDLRTNFFSSRLFLQSILLSTGIEGELNGIVLVMHVDGLQLVVLKLSCYRCHTEHVCLGG